MKKTTANNRRKKLPLLLGALLIISVAAYGTRAYFSDSATEQANIALELGNVQIAMDNTSNWKYTPSNSAVNKNLELTKNNKDKISGNSILNNLEFSEASIENVRPGDSFTRKFKITNTGSLDVKMYAKSASSSDDSPFITTISGIEDGTILEANKETDYFLTITVVPGKEGSGNAKNVEVGADKIALAYLTENLTVKAVQTNADENVNQ